MSEREKLKKAITVANLAKAAGSVYFQRGEDYADSGLVRDLRLRDGHLTALVDGSRLYETSLYEEDGFLEGDCSCPLGDRDEFCKHLVATGLVWISQQKGVPTDAGEGRSDTEILAAWLKKLKKAELVELVVNRCHEDVDYFDLLLVRASAAQLGGDLSEMKRTIQQTYCIHGFVDWRESYSYTCKLDQVNETLRGMLDSGKAADVMELAEYAIERWEIAIQNIDDSDGGMGCVFDDLHELHLQAARKAKPDGKVLAERLFETAMASGWETFGHAYEAYQSIWRVTGKARYRTLVEKEWKKLPKIKPNGNDQSEYGKPRWLSGLMVRFAQEDGDFERELEIMQRNLSDGWRFMQLAKRYEEEDQLDGAVEWLEKGRKYFKKDSQIEEQLAGLYWKQRRHGEALSIYWKLFEQRRSLDTYKELADHAKKLKSLGEWRTKALASIHADIAGRKKEAKRDTWWAPVDHSLLVEIFLWEKDVEQAWREAVQGGCSGTLKLRLCKKREQAHPEEIFPIYLQVAEQEVQKKKNDAYRNAVRYIKQAKKLAEQSGRLAVFDAGLLEIQTTHKPKRNFMKYLAEAGLRTI